GWALWGTDAGRFYAATEVLAAVPDGAAVLDVPCGGGVALRGLRPGQRVRYVGADISPDMLARARRRAAQLKVADAQFPLADITALPFADAEFDLCVSFNGLHCLPDPAAAVREIARCLKPGARLVGASLVRGAGWRHDRTLDLFARTGVFGPGGTVAQLRGWLADAGLTVDTLEQSGAVAHFSARR
ncbi:MAG TPA: class I SAM-dependent methyltransferase, partial [Mycolicibacillus parakoreensis]|nr:class I SAM-dependent methyltransferase [Mycolicibacillus parakoreensis]